MTKDLHGILTALVTPFGEDGEVDHDVLRTVVDRSIDGGLDAVVVGGGTGEWAWLSEEERLAIFDTVIEHTAGRVPVVANTGAMSTAQAIRVSRAAERAGADVIMLAAPYYEPLTVPELTRYIKTVASSVQLPVMMYNNPGVFGVNLDAPTLASIARDVENIRYVKDSSHDWEQALRLIYHHGDDVRLIMGWDTFSFSALIEGAVGVMAGVGNVVPTELAAVYGALRDGDIERARVLWRHVYPVVDALISVPFVQAVKAGMRLQGVPVGLPREPLAELPAEDLAVVEAALARLKS